MHMFDLDRATALVQLQLCTERWKTAYVVDLRLEKKNVYGQSVSQQKFFIGQISFRRNSIYLINILYVLTLAVFHYICAAHLNVEV